MTLRSLYSFAVPILPVFNNTVHGGTGSTIFAETNGFFRRLRYHRRRALSNSGDLIRDLILIILYHVVSFRTEIEVAVTYYIEHKGRCFSIGSCWHESTSQELYCLSTETWQAGVEHKRHQRNYCLLVGPAEHCTI